MGSKFEQHLCCTNGGAILQPKTTDYVLYVVFNPHKFYMYRFLYFFIHVHQLFIKSNVVEGWRFKHQRHLAVLAGHPAFPSASSWTEDDVLRKSFSVSLLSSFLTP